jgi:hypothetical protein
MAQKHVILGDKNNVEILTVLGAGMGDSRWVFIAVIAWAASMASTWAEYKKLKRRYEKKK